MDAAKAQQAVRKLIEAEFSAGFPLLRRIPSTFVWKVLAHIDGLRADERDILFEVLAERSSGWFQTDINMEQYAERQRELVRHPAYQSYCSAQTRVDPWKYADPSFLRGWLDGLRRSEASQSTPRPEPDFSPVALAVVEATAPPVTAGAVEIRKEVKRVFAELFNAQPTKLGAGMWNYLGDCQGRPFTLTLDYGGKMHKLTYGVGLGRFPAKQPFLGATWEGIFAIPNDWNFVCQHNLSQSVALLAEIVEKIVTLRQQV
jgi:hypothetical protein